MDPLRQEYLRQREAREQQMIALYLERVPVDQIAINFGVSEAAVRALMHKRRIQRPLKPKPVPDPDLSPLQQYEKWQDLSASKTARDRELIARYEAGENTPSLKKAFNLSRERVCQILRRANTIELRRGRRQAAKDAQQEVVAKIKAETTTAYQAKIDNAVALARSGVSWRQARMQAFGDWSNHTNDDAAVSSACKAAGLRHTHGRHRDLSHRRAKLVELHDKGFTMSEAIRFMRASGDKIHGMWINTHCPDIWAMAKCPVCNEFFVQLNKHLKNAHPDHDNSQQNHSHPANPDQG
jgi:transposase